MKENLLQIKPFQETLNESMCGPACFKMILSYWNIEKTEAECAVLLNHNTDLGVTDINFINAVKSLNLSCEIKNNSSFGDIQDYLNKKIPLIINWFTSGRSDYNDSNVPDGHYSIVVGIDDKNIYLQDPEIGKLRKISRDDFYKVWFDFSTDHITKWNDMIIRQIIAIYLK